MDQQNQSASTTSPQAENKSSLPEASVLLKEAWRQFKLNWQQYVSILAGLYVVVIIYSIFASSTEHPKTLFDIIGGIVIAILGIVTQIGLLTAIVKKDTAMTVSDAYRKGLELFWKYLWVQVLVGTLVILGFIVFIIPGIYLAIRYSMTAFVFIDEDKKGMNALNRSRDLLKGVWSNVFFRYLVLGLVTIAIYIPTGILFGNGWIGQLAQTIVGLIWMPVSVLYSFNIYQALKKSANS